MSLEKPTFLECVVQAAKDAVGVREIPPKSNRSSVIDNWLRMVGLDPTKAGYSWCCAFTYGICDAAAKAVGVENPHYRTAVALKHFLRAPMATRITVEEALADPSLLKPGVLFFEDHESGSNKPMEFHKGHTGVVLGVSGPHLISISGNTNMRGSREGDGVYNEDHRRIATCVGFVDYSRVVAEPIT
jgi:hypothetical protein